MPFLFFCISCLFWKGLVVSCLCLNTVHIGDDGLHSCRTYRVVGGQVYEGHEEFAIGLNREGFLLRAWREETVGWVHVLGMYHCDHFSFCFHGLAGRERHRHGH